MTIMVDLNLLFKSLLLSGVVIMIFLLGMFIGYKINNRK